MEKQEEKRSLDCTENKYPSEQQSQNPKKYTTGKKTPTYKKILKKLLSKNNRTLEYMIDEICNFRLENVEEVINKIINLTESGTIIIMKTNKGFIYKIKKKNGDAE